MLRLCLPPIAVYTKAGLAIVSASHTASPRHLTPFSSNNIHHHSTPNHQLSFLLQQQNVQTSALPIHGPIVEVVPLALTAATTVLLLLLPVRVVIVLTGDVALGAPLLRALGLRHLLVSSAAIRETKLSMSEGRRSNKRQVFGEYCDQNYEGTSSTIIYGTSKRGKENPHPTLPNKSLTTSPRGDRNRICWLCTTRRLYHCHHLLRQQWQPASMRKQARVTDRLASDRSS